MLVGGPSQLDTWDMKPDAPASIRGPFKPIKTNVSGIEISEIFPRMAKHADKFALLRSVYHTAAAVHDTGCQMMQTGRLFQGGLESPNFGSVLRFEKGPLGDMPPNVLLPYPIGQLGGNLPHGDTAGFLGKGFDPFVLNADPADPNFKVPDLLPPDYISAVRVDRRRSWRQEVDKSVQYFEDSNQDSKLMDSTFNQAYTLMTSAKAREAFELSQEPEDVRKRYGMNRFGQGCLLARRLVERGVRFVTLNRRIRTHAAHQSRRRSRSLAAVLDRRFRGRRGQGRADCRRLGPNRRGASGPPSNSRSHRGYCIQVPWHSGRYGIENSARTRRAACGYRV